MVPLLEHDDTVMLDCSQTRPTPPGIFILDDAVRLVVKRIEIFPAPHRKCSAFPRKIRPIGVTSGGLMRYILSVVWYGLHVACNEAFLIKLFNWVFSFLRQDAHVTFYQ
jgi:hypothetical protein